MNWLSDHAIELVLIALYLAVIAHRARVGRRNVRSLGDYLVAGHSRHRTHDEVLGLALRGLLPTPEEEDRW